MGKMMMKKKKKKKKLMTPKMKAVTRMMTMMIRTLMPVY